MRKDLCIITSLYRAAEEIEVFGKRLCRVLDVLEEANVKTELVLIANDANNKEDKLLRRLVADVSEKAKTKMIRVPRETLYTSWNKGLKNSNAEAIAFWNIDDDRNAASLLEGLGVLGHKESLFVPPFVMIRWKSLAGIKGRPTIHYYGVERLKNDLKMGEFALGTFFMTDRKLFEKIGLFDERFHIAGDYEWQMRALRKVEPQWGTACGGTMFASGDNLSGSGNPRLIVERIAIFRRHGIAMPDLLTTKEEASLLKNYEHESYTPADRNGWRFEEQWKTKKKRAAIKKFWQRPFMAILRRAKRFLEDK